MGAEAVALVDSSVLLMPDFVTDDAWVMSVVALGELELGVRVAADDREREIRRARLESLLEEADVLPVDGSVASEYAKLRAATGRKPSNDLWIAATAVAHGLTLVTADERQSKLPGVRAQFIRPEI